MGTHHDLRFTYLRHGQAYRAESQLPPGEECRFVGLGVRPETQTMLRAIPGHAAQVPFHDVEIDDERRSIQV
jgi:hypothetical protein